MKDIKLDVLDIKKVLMLVIDNLYTSTSKVGLEHRAKNLKEMQKELLFMLQLTQQEAEDIYWKEFVK